MTPAELEAKYLPHIRRMSSLRLLPTEVAIQLLHECTHVNLRLLGVEAFRLIEGGGVQPALEYSNISYGTIERTNNEVEFKPELRLRTPWNTDPEALLNTRALVEEGATHGYGWYEVSLKDIESDELLFFRGNA